jgi:glutamine---fructose-6-phosphate transaminase (isomerizing)
MCGIVGILWDHEAAPTLVEALKRLEYRGYDSAGHRHGERGRLDRRRAVGKLVNLSDLLVHEPLAGKSGIGHTRWATHGAPPSRTPTRTSAAPSPSSTTASSRTSATCARTLAAKGYAAESETDTETVALLAQSFMDQGLAPRDAAGRPSPRLDGAFALAFLFEGEDDLMIAARKGSPLAIGHGDGEMFLGSDAIALAPMTDRITYLEEGDRAVLTRKGVEIVDAAGRRSPTAPSAPSRSTPRGRQGRPQALHGQGDRRTAVVVAEAIAHYVTDDGIRIAGRRARLRPLRPGRDGRLRHRLLRLPHREILVRAGRGPAGRGRYRLRVPLPRAAAVGPNTLAIFVSQSGETADTLAALRYCAERRPTLAVVNVAESSIARESDLALPILAGPRSAWPRPRPSPASSRCSHPRAQGGAGPGPDGEATLAGRWPRCAPLPGLMAQALTADEEIRDIAYGLSEGADALFLGRGAMYPLALEGALKLKEISYIHAEGYASGELKHGPIALIDGTMPVIVMAPHDSLFDKTVSNMQEVMARAAGDPRHRPAGAERAARTAPGSGS